MRRWLQELDMVAVVIASFALALVIGVLVDFHTRANQCPKWHEEMRGTTTSRYEVGLDGHLYEYPAKPRIVRVCEE